MSNPTPNQQAALDTIAILKWWGDAPDSLGDRVMDALFENVMDDIDNGVLAFHDEQMAAAIDAANAGWDEDDLDQYSVAYWEAVLAALG